MVTLSMIASTRQKPASPGGRLAPVQRRDRRASRSSEARLLESSWLDKAQVEPHVIRSCGHDRRLRSSECRSFPSFPSPPLPPLTSPPTCVRRTLVALCCWTTWLQAASTLKAVGSPTGKAGVKNRHTPIENYAGFLKFGTHHRALQGTQVFRKKPASVRQ